MWDLWLHRRKEATHKEKTDAWSKHREAYSLEWVLYNELRLGNVRGFGRCSRVRGARQLFLLLSAVPLWDTSFVQQRIFASLWCLPTRIGAGVNSNWRSSNIWVFRKDLTLLTVCTAILPLPLLLLVWNKLEEMKSRSPFTGASAPCRRA